MEEIVLFNNWGLIFWWNFFNVQPGSATWGRWRPASSFRTSYSSSTFTNIQGRSPGLVVMGGDSCTKGHGFESQHRILDGHISYLFVVKIVLFVWKDKNKRKRGQEWHIKKLLPISSLPLSLSLSLTSFEIDFAKLVQIYSRPKNVIKFSFHFCVKLGTFKCYKCKK